ncbi:MAG: PDZ domain-containing protein [Steroidobacteraceae bacterium]
MNPNASLRRLLALGLMCGLGGAAVAAEPATPAPAGQQQQLEQQLDAARGRLAAAAREVGELSAQLGRDTQGRMQWRFAGGPPPRATLGVQVQGQRADGGARVVAISPGGPAQAAGVQVGDVITAIGGADIAGNDEPGRALAERVRELDPGLKVKLAVLRDGRRMELDITPRAAPRVAMFRAAPGMRMPGAGMPGGPGVPGFAPRSADRFRGMEFATLSERLGGYFGVKAGVLVVRAGEGGVFRLQDGDVVLAIDGREPRSAAHATRILSSYQPGEKLVLKVQRERRVQSIEVTLPEDPRAFRGQRGEGGPAAARPPRG